MKKENNNSSKLKKIVKTLVISILIVIVTPIAIIFLSFFLAGLADNDSYSSKDGSTQLLEPGCPAFTKNDGSDFNWSKIKSNQMLENCMFELAYKLETPEKMANWLENEGFKKVNSYSTGTPDDEVVWAYWYPRNQETPRPYQSFYYKLYDSIFTYPYAIGVSYTDNNVKESSASLLTK